MNFFRNITEECVESNAKVFKTQAKEDMTLSMAAASNGS